MKLLTISALFEDLTPVPSPLGTEGCLTNSHKVEMNL